MTGPDFSLPARDLLERQSARLAHLRARLLRRCQIATRRRILDLGCGYGAVTPELVRRGGGQVIALDRQHRALTAAPDEFSGSIPICGDATRLPFADVRFDLVYSQFALLWMNLKRALAEIVRVLQPGGILAAIEPDYGGMIEFPDAIRAQPVWIAALERGGADPYVARRIPSELARHGFDVHVELVPELNPFEETGLDLLRDLPLTENERSHLERLEQTEQELPRPWSRIVHLPLFLISALKPL